MNPTERQTLNIQEYTILTITLEVDEKCSICTHQAHL